MQFQPHVWDRGQIVGVKEWLGDEDAEVETFSRSLALLENYRLLALLSR